MPVLVLVAALGVTIFIAANVWEPAIYMAYLLAILLFPAISMNERARGKTEDRHQEYPQTRQKMPKRPREEQQSH